MSALAERVYAGVRSSGAVNPNLVAGYPFESSLQLILHGFAMALALPAGETTTIVGDDQLEPLRHRALKPALRGSCSRLAGYRDNPAESSGLLPDPRNRGLPGSFFRR